MSFNGPILEKWLLNGEAVQKNLSIGGAGLCKIPVPLGKTFIITKIEILPFLNIIDPNESFAAGETFYDGISQDLYNILKRTQYQLLFYNTRINNIYNIRNEFSISTTIHSNAINTLPSINCKKTDLECFHVVEEDSWLFLKFFNFNAPNQATLSSDNYNLSLDGSQNWSPSNNLYGYYDQSDISKIGSTGITSAYQYFPQGYGNPSSVLTGVEQFILPSFQYAGTNPNSALSLPISDQSNLDLLPSYIQSLPFYNISIIEINRRLSTEQLL